MGKETSWSLWECDQAKEKGSNGNSLIGWSPSLLLLRMQSSPMDSYDQCSKNSKTKRKSQSLVSVCISVCACECVNGVCVQVAHEHSRRECMDYTPQQVVCFNWKHTVQSYLWWAG